eukprot:724990-Lingulodinium_polyedra.AAC.1
MTRIVGTGKNGTGNTMIGRVGKKPRASTPRLRPLAAMGCPEMPPWSLAAMACPGLFVIPNWRIS